jgi:hypothetical protein
MAKIKSTLEKLPLDTDIIIDAYGLKKILNGSILDNWLSATGKLNDFENQLLDLIYKKSFDRMGGWNEEELKMKLISHIFLIADFEVENEIATFYERILAQDVGSYHIHVKCDCLIAKPLGLTTPKSPYFFLQEFKKGKGDSYDPEGQMLAAMLVAQQRNQDNEPNATRPIFGAWLTGSIWYFTVIENQNYYFSKALDATEKDTLLQIVFILRKLKELILA